MIKTTFQSADAYLLDDVPDWNRPLDLRATLPTHAEVGLTGRETRRTQGASLRLGLRFSAVLSDGALAGWREASETLTTEPVLCPLWMYPIASGEASPDVTADYYVLMGDGDPPSIQAAAGLPFARPSYPLMVGRLEQMPDPSLWNDELALVTVAFVEDDELYLSFPAVSPTNGPTAGGSARPIWPWRPNWATQPKTGSFHREVERRQIGQGRLSAHRYFDQTGRRHIDYSFILENLQPWQLLRFFLEREGDVENFWLPGGVADARLSSNVLSTDTSLSCNQAYPYNGTAGYILLDDLVNQAACQVTDGSTSTWTLSGQVGQAFTASQTRVDSLILARFSRPTITLSFEDALLARANVDFLEVVDEVTDQTGETIGDTMGALPGLAYLYRFSVTYPDATEEWFYTSYEQDLTWSSDTYTAQQIEHGQITEDLGLARHELDVSMRSFSGNPVERFLPFSLEYPLKLEIWEADLVSGSVNAATKLFIGEIVQASTDGPYIRARARTFTWLLERQVPRQVIQPTCNWALFETLCGLDPDDWKWQGEVDTYNSSTLELALINVSRVSGPGASLVIHYFAGGYLKLGSGTGAEYRSLADSAAAVGNTITLVLLSPFTTAPSGGETVYFHPGCDATYSICVNKFNNRTRFGGFPYTPVGNPSALKISKNVTGGGKK